GDPATQRVVQIDVDPRHIGVRRPVRLGIVADVKQGLVSLASALEARRARARDPSFLARCRRAAEEWWGEQMRVVESWAGPGLHPARVIQAIGTAFGPGAIYVTDGGFTSLWAYWFLPPTRPRSYLSILELGMLGTGVPAALGAKLGSPAREVVCVTGDGAAGFHFMEMQSAAREGAKITVIVFAEGSWSMEVPNEQMLYGRNFGTAWRTVPGWTPRRRRRAAGVSNSRLARGSGLASGPRRARGPRCAGSASSCPSTAAASSPAPSRRSGRLPSRGPGTCGARTSSAPRWRVPGERAGTGAAPRRSLRARRCSGPSSRGVPSA